MNILGFLGVSILLTLMPGPDILFVITQSISQGKKSGITFALGLCSGLIFHTSAAAFGLSVILYKSEVAFQIVQYLGAAYLIYLGVLSLVHRHQNAFELDLNQKREGVKLYRKGILMNILNPKVSLFFVAFFPQFVDMKTNSSAFQMFILGLVFILQAIVVFSIVAYIADKLAFRLMRNPKISLVFNWFQAIILFIIGINIGLNKFI